MYFCSRVKASAMPAEYKISKTTNTYDTIVQPDRRTQILLTGRTVQDRIRGITQTVSYTHDSYGHPAVETVNFGDNIVRTTSNIYYNNTGTPYILGALSDRTVTVTRNGASNSKRMYVSSHSHGIPLTAITYANGYQTAEKTYKYNSTGCVTSESVRPYTSPDALKDSVEYDIYGRITKQTNPLGLYTTFEYNPLTGVLERTRDHRSQATVYGYDNLHRRMYINYPDGSVNHTYLDWSTGAGLYTLSSLISGEPLTSVFRDAFGRTVRNSVIRYDGSVLNTDVEYDSYGRAYRESLPFKGGGPALWNTASFDIYDRPTAVSFASGKNATYSYSGKNVTSVSNGVSSTFCYDTQGSLTSVIDPAGTVSCNLRPDGQPSSIVAPENVTTSFAYDGYGRQTGITDPGAGNRAYEYDAAGNLYRETDADNRVKTMYYDRYGRITSKVLPEFTAYYRYGSDGLLASDSCSNGTYRTYQYNTYGKIYKDRDNAPDGKWLERTYWFYSGNLIGSITFDSQSGYIGVENYIQNNFCVHGITFNNTGVWNLNSENAFGQPTSVTTGPVTRTYGYDPYGIPAGRSANSISGGTFQNHTYGFDPLKGNLGSRKDNTRNLQENFTYDGLNRLKTFAGFSMEYDPKGNITEKSDAGNTFYYNTPNRPYAVSGVEAGANTAIPPRNQTVTHTSFERPAGITENGYEALFTYSGSGVRKKMELRQNSNTVLQRYYLGGGRYEYDATPAGIAERLYIGGDAYTAPAVYVKTGTNAWALYYICRDHLGSITHLINSSGAVAEEYSYDAWGRLRDPVTQTAYTPGTEPAMFLNRGYTGHEHLPWFGLINMNARLYDPAIGQFLSPDPYVANPANSLDYNRFMYARNNPLIYTDPNGEFLLLSLFLFHTDMGYKVQKMFSPVAVKFDFHLGSDQRGIGANVSVGGSHLSPVSNRWHWGATYYTKYFDTGMKGWETRSGSEVTITPYFSYGGTKYKFNGLDQTTNLLTLGGPFRNLMYENDYETKELSWIPFVPKGSSDKFRTAAVQINRFGRGFGFNIFTGDPGHTIYDDEGNPESTNVDKEGYYINNGTGDPDKYRFGALYIKGGPVRLGWNSEGIRSGIQNKIHNWTGDPFFRFMPYSRFFWYYGTGTGNSLW